MKVKYACDRILAGVGNLPAPPTRIRPRLGVMLSMGRPIFFRQRRVGLDGHEFEMLKFRSMSAGSGTQLGRGAPRRIRSRAGSRGRRG